MFFLLTIVLLYYVQNSLTYRVPRELSRYFYPKEPLVADFPQVQIIQPGQFVSPSGWLGRLFSFYRINRLSTHSHNLATTNQCISKVHIAVISFSDGRSGLQHLRPHECFPTHHGWLPRLCS